MVSEAGDSAGGSSVSGRVHRIIGLLQKPHWWGGAFVSVVKNRRHFVLPAALLTAGNLLTVVANQLVFSGMTLETVDVGQLAVLALGSLSLCLAALAVSLFALNIWLMRLIAFCRLAISGQSQSSVLANEIAVLKQQKNFVGQVMLWSSLVLFGPALLLAMLIGFSVACSPQFKILGQRLIELPDWAPPVMSLLTVLLSVAGVAYMMLVIALCGIQTPAKGKDIAIAALRIFLVDFSAVAAVSIVVSVINILITAPQLLMLCTPAGACPAESFWMNLAMQIWFGVSSVFIWPLSVLPYCELIRSHAWRTQSAAPA